MVQYLEKYKENIAIDMRKRGMSYSEISTRIHVPKSTLAYWLRKVKLTPEQEKKLAEKRIKVAKANAAKRTSKTKKQIAETISSAARDIKEISKKELWLAGIILYWKNGNTADLKKGVHFSSNDPGQIKLFLKWLKDIGGIPESEIRFDVFAAKAGKRSEGKKIINNLDGVIKYWADKVDFPRANFANIYCQGEGAARSNNFQPSRAVAGKSYTPGFLRVRVLASCMLARQIAGWIDGVNEYYWKEG